MTQSAVFPGAAIITGLPSSTRRAMEAQIWYFAYGSNLSSLAFSGDRKLKPLASVVARIPGWHLVFDTPGMPYHEPVYASIQRQSSISGRSYLECEKSAASWPIEPDVVGVAYLLTRCQYAHLIASEAGGAVYDEVEMWSTVVGTTEAHDHQSVRVRTLRCVEGFRRSRGYPSQRYMVRLLLFPVAYLIKPYGPKMVCRPDR